MSARRLQTARAFPFQVPTPGVASVSPSRLTCFLDNTIVTAGALLVVVLALVTAMFAPVSAGS